MNKFLTVAATAVLTAASFAAPAVAEYPEKPVNFIVPWPPGDLEDVLTRMIAEDFQAEYGVAASVVNKPGGGPLPGTIEVANAPADGYTIGSFVIAVPLIGHVIGIPELAEHAKTNGLALVTSVHRWSQPKCPWPMPNPQGLNGDQKPPLMRWIATRWPMAMRM